MRKIVLNKIVYAVAIMCMVITILYCPTDVYAATGSVTFGSESYEARDNSQFQVGVYLKTESKMGSYHVEVEYDKSRMEYTGGAESESNGVITLEGIGVSDQIKYMLSFKTISGGDAYIKVKNAYIYTSDANSTEQFDMTELDEAGITIEGEDTGTPRTEEPTEYVGPFETDIPHLEPSIKLNDTDYYVVDSNQYVPESVSWKYVLVPGKLGDMDVTFYSNEAQDIFFLSLVDSNGETHLYSYSNSQKQLYECNFYNTGNTIYYYTSPYASDSWPEGLTEDVIKKQNICYALRSDGESGFYKVEADKLTLWNVDENIADAKPMTGKLIFIMIIAIITGLALIVLVYFWGREVGRARRKKKNSKKKRVIVSNDIKQIKNDDVEKTENHLNEKGEEPIISVQDVTMKFKIYNSSASGMKDFLIQKLKHQINYRELYALDHVSFDVYKGEVVGIIGTNGSGKSTMLRIVSGALNPSGGKVVVDRRKVQLLTLGTGFDMELTARENIYLNGAIIGYSKKFIDEHFDEIIDFAELQDFVDEKVKNFSSGMVSRLGFAIATAGDAAEILILDEVLSVGDEFFRKKSLARVKEMIHGGSTVLMVSHGMGTILENCSKVVWIEKGKLQMVGDPKTVCAAYRKQQNV